MKEINYLDFTEEEIENGVKDEFGAVYSADGCKLKEIELPDSIIYIGKGCFQYCESLKKVNIPRSMTFIEDEVFDECNALKKVTIPDTIISIGYSAFGESTKYNIPDSVVHIEDGWPTRL